MNERGFALASILAILALIAFAVGLSAQNSRRQLNLLGQHRDYLQSLSSCMRQGDVLAGKLGELSSAANHGKWSKAVTDKLGVLVQYTARRFNTHYYEVQLQCQAGRQHTRIYLTVAAGARAQYYVQ